MDGQQSEAPGHDRVGGVAAADVACLVHSLGVCFHTAVVLHQQRPTQDLTYTTNVAPALRHAADMAQLTRHDTQHPISSCFPWLLLGSPGQPLAVIAVQLELS